MPKNCFIDKNGGVFKTKSLWFAASNIPTSIYTIDTKTILEEKVRWKIENFNDFIVHFKRVSNADLSKPLIVRSDGYVMDGWHRIARAIIKGISELPQKKFTLDPRPDYFISKS